MLNLAHQLLDTIFTASRTLDASDFAEIFTTFPQPYADYPELDTSASVPFHLPVVLVPPEIVELDGISSEASEEPKASPFRSRRIPIRQLDMLFDRRWWISSKSLRSTGTRQPRTQRLEIKATCAQLLPTCFADHLDLAICFVFNCLGSVRFMNVIDYLFLCSPRRLQILRHFGPRFQRCVLLDYLATTSAQFDLDQQHVKCLHTSRPPHPPARCSIARDRCPFPRPRLWKGKSPDAPP